MSTKILPFAVALAVALLLAACGGGQQPPQSSPLAEVVSPVASDTPVDLAQADKLYHDGDFEGAIAIYSAAALRSDDQQRRQALWRLARIQYASGDYRSAEPVIIAFLSAHPAPADEARAYLLLGAVQSAQGHTTDARDSLLRYLDLNGPAAPYAHLRLAELAGAAGDPSEAIGEIDLALAQGPLPGPVHTDARFARARYRDAAGDTAGAIVDYQQLASDAATASDRAEALWQLAGLSRRAADGLLYQGSLYSLATRYPWHARALEALDQPPLAPSPLLSNAQRATVLFAHRLNDRAAEAFRASLAEDASPEAQAVGHYHLGILAERAGDPDAALAEYQAAREALAADPSHPAYAQASWDRALVLEAQGRLDEAAGAYAALADAAPAAEQAPEALFRAGLLRYRQGRIEDAATLWQRSLDLVIAPAAARAHFWLARAASAAGDQPSASRELGLAASSAPLAYYGLRARALLEGDVAVAESSGTVQAPAPDWGAVERWLQSWAGPEGSPPGGALLDSAAWRRALELETAGLRREAGQEFAQLLDDATGRPWRLYRLARALAEERRVPEAARAAARLVQGWADAPRELLALAYPREYLDLADQTAGQYGFSPLLLLALVRQESFFEAGAVSGAGALGLTQVIPSTAQEIAGQLGEEAFRTGDLLRPRVSLRFGAHYLGSQLTGFGGNLVAALAAYNGGPGNAGRWLRQAGEDDPDLLLETIDFSETHAYVRLVLENYALYRYTYGQTDHPSLPLP
ncbi:MAG: transglycosylase SLT domain-containing protein [Chloroflexi bacterium]|nr:transglycosylase SLT domain-containing protein [Chloroflexota bacterium]